MSRGSDLSRTITSASRPEGHPQRVHADHAAAEDDDLRRRDARHAAEQYASSAGLALEGVGTGLDRHPAGHLAHRRQQRQTAALVGDGLVGDGDAAGLDQTLGLGTVRGQVQVGEQDLPLAEHPDLGRLRLLDLDHELGPAEDRGGIRSYLRAGRSIEVVVEIDRLPGTGLDDDLVTVGHELTNGARRQANTELVVLDLAGHTDKHLDLSGRSGYPS